MIHNAQKVSAEVTRESSGIKNEFDPYHRWLGIPPNEQPPNHYRLLGIPLFENQCEVIRNAADQRMTYLKTYGSGQHSELSQQLLNEVSAAKVCLLDEARKHAYDEQLRMRLAASYSSQEGAVQDNSTVVGIGEAPLRTNRERQASPPVEEFCPEIRATSNTSRSREKKRTKSRFEKRQAAQIIVAGILGLIIGFLVLWRIDPLHALVTVFIGAPEVTLMEINNPIESQVGDVVRVPLRVQNEDYWRGHLEFTIAADIQNKDYSLNDGVFLWTPKDRHRGNTYQFKVHVAVANNEDLSDESTFQVKVLGKGAPTDKASGVSPRVQRYRTEALGGDGAPHWHGGVVVNDSAPEEAYLVGLRLMIAGWIAGIQPVYQNSSGVTTFGEHYGRRGKTQEVMAPDGHAVGGLVVKAHDAVDGMRVIFMRKQGDSLDSEDVKQSRWYGGRGGNPEKKLGGTGARIVGIHGRTGDYADYGHFMRCLGLIVERHDQTTSRSKVTSSDLDESSGPPKSGASSNDISADSRKPQSHGNEDDAVLGICDFERPPALVRDHGNVDTGSAKQEDGNHFFQFQYSKVDAARAVGPASPHCGYGVTAQPATPTVSSVLVFRYRTDGISDLRLTLNMQQDHLLWFLDLAPAAEWTEMRLPLRDKLFAPIEGQVVRSLHLTTFAKIPDSRDRVFLDLDDFRFEVEDLPASTVKKLERELSEKAKKLADLKQFVRVANLRTDKGTYAEGERIEVEYDVVNIASKPIPVPLNKQYSRPRRLLGGVQAWIEPMDDQAQRTDFGRAAKRGTRYGAGGGIFSVSQDHLSAGKRCHRKGGIRRDLKPGRYRYYVELKAIDDESSINEQMTEFTVQAAAD